MREFIKRVLAWILAVTVTVVLGVAFQTQNVIARLGEIGANVTIGERLSMTGYDIFHLGSMYGIFILIAFFLAFLVGGTVFRFAKFCRHLIYAVAGAIAILAMLFAMKNAFFDVHLIAGARDGIGIAMQMLAGAIGGFVFALISRPQEKAFADEAKA